MLLTSGLRPPRAPIAGPLWTPPSFPVSGAFYVAPGGSDSNAGTLAAPFLTLEKARSSMAASGTSKTTYLRAGTYTLTATLNLTSSDNGEAFFAYPGEVPIVSTTTLANVIYVNGASRVIFWGIQLQGAVAGTNTACMFFNSCNACLIIGNRFVSNDVGLLLAGTTNSLISGNQADTHATCWCELKDGSNYNLIDSNKITGVNNNANTSNGAIYGHGINWNVVSHNEVTNCYGAGITIVNFDGPTGAIYTKNVGNRVNYNVVRNCCTKASDGGAIYTVGRAEIDTKMQIVGNLIDGVTSDQTNPHALGIYLDDEANWVEVRDNIVRGISASNIGQFHAGQNCTMVNNIFHFSSGTLGLLFQDSTYAPSTQTAANGNIGPNNVFRNIFYATSSITPYVDLTGGTRSIIGNVYPTGTTLSSPNTDSNPIFGDPGFANPAAGNYTLPAGSIAFQIGFQPIDQTQYGLKPRTPRWY